MQKLTARGIRLASHFRSLGIPVIESYPGAAQDIMGIPRKRASLEFLARGLELFGLKGSFTDHPVSHDELDAITSAVVGLFFWSGKFEALGDEAEEYLMIPDLQIDAKPWKERRVIGLSGPIAAGKTTAGRFIESLGFVYGSYSSVLKQLLADQGIEQSRENLQEKGAEINKRPGQRWLCKHMRKMLPASDDIVIDGLRHPDDHAFMVESFGPAFCHIHIDSSKDIRKARYIATGGSSQEFLKAIGHSVETEVSKLSSLSHKTVCNEDDIRAFERSILKSLQDKTKK
jgi:dephospho-CoA kinase